MLGAFCLISLGLLVASRSKSEELIGGLLNVTSWPMMMLSGVWFSLEGAPPALKSFADFLPLTHVTSLVVMSIIFLSLGAYFFSWNTER